MRPEAGGDVSVPERHASERLFHRDLPGGGYVAIELTAAVPAEERRVRVIVERRRDRDRRVGHMPPTIIEEHWQADRGLGDLYRIVCDNSAIARGLLRISRAD